MLQAGKAPQAWGIQCNCLHLQSRDLCTGVEHTIEPKLAIIDAIATHLVAHVLDANPRTDRQVLQQSVTMVSAAGQGHLFALLVVCSVRPVAAQNCQWQHLPVTCKAYSMSSCLRLPFYCELCSVLCVRYVWQPPSEPRDDCCSLRIMFRSGSSCMIYQHYVAQLACHNCCSHTIPGAM